MKKLVLLFLTLTVSVFSFSQNKAQEYVDISENFGNQIVNNFQIIEGNLKDLVDKDTISILFMPVFNSNGDYTEITEQISKRIAAFVQQNIKAHFSRYSHINVIFSKNRFPKCDFYLMLNYSISGNEIILENIFLHKRDFSSRVSLPNCKSQFVADLPSDDAIIFQPKKYLITVNELNLSSQSTFIKNIVSSNMLNYDCVLSDQNSDADYIISITANVAQDRKLYGIYFCNADVVLKITDKKTHIPVYQNTYTKYKCGSNISFQDAADNTFKDVADKISADILTFLAF